MSTFNLTPFTPPLHTFPDDVRKITQSISGDIYIHNLHRMKQVLEPLISINAN